MIGYKDETVQWSRNSVIVCNPSKDQCMEVIAQISASQIYVILIRMTPECTEILLPFILNRKVEGTTLLIKETPMHGLVHHISSQLNTLETLALMSCSIDDDDVIPLAQSLKHNTSLFELCLNSNPGMTSESVFALAELLISNNSLRSLVLWETKISHFGLSALFKSLEKNGGVSLEISAEYEESCKSIPSYLPVMHRISFM